jgi:hypothetical protein
MIHLFMNRKKDIFVGLFLFVAGSMIFPLQTCAEEKKKKEPPLVKITKRDPFWPVGFVSKRLSQNNKVKNKGPKGPVDWKKAMNNVKINGVSKKGTEYVAIINNRVKKVGDTVVLTFEGSRYEWIVESITATGSENLVKLKPSKVE